MRTNPFIPIATLFVSSHPEQAKDALQRTITRAAPSPGRTTLEFNVIDLLLQAETGEDIDPPSFNVYRVDDDNRFHSKDEYARYLEAANKAHNPYDDDGYNVLIYNLEYVSFNFIPSDARRVVWKWLEATLSRAREADDVNIFATFVLNDGANGNHFLRKVERLFDRTIQIKREVKKALSPPIPPLETIFHDVIGYEETKAELDRLIRWRWYKSSSMKRLGIVKGNQGFGALLVGPSGCGKTKLAEALGREPGVHFISVKFAEVYSKWFGDSERHLREIFANARQMRPCILFLDEIETFAPERSANEDQSGLNARIIATLLNEIDGVDSDNEGLIVLGATTDISKVDRALTRPGRLGSIVNVGLPSQEDRKKLLLHFVNGINLDANSDFWLEEIAKKTRGFSVAQLESLCQAAVSKAIWSMPTFVSPGSLVLCEAHFHSARQSMVNLPSIFSFA